MTPMIEEHRTEIENLCRQYSVRRLQLFGSAARGEFDPSHSDLDFFVEFRESDYRGSSDRYFGLLHGLEDLFGRRIDLVEPEMVRSRIFLEL
jgi:predicted nucleotidyltransferase